MMARAPPTPSLLLFELAAGAPSCAFFALAGWDDGALSLPLLFLEPSPDQALLFLACSPVLFAWASMLSWGWSRLPRLVPFQARVQALSARCLSWACLLSSPSSFPTLSFLFPLAPLLGGKVGDWGGGCVSLSPS
jgi:hypothetical protein